MQEIVFAFAVCEITEITDLGGRLMGKRSNFERREADFYPTPRAAVLPLIPHLRGSGIRTFAEPCAGDGAWSGTWNPSAYAVSMLAT